MKIYIYKVFSLFLFLFSVFSFSQKFIENFEIDSITYLHKEIKKKKRIVNFIEATNNDNNPKDLIIFIQGSNVTPLISEDEGGKFLIIPFEIKNYLKDNLFLFVSKPFIPIFKNAKDLDENYNIIDKKILYDYQKLNTLNVLLSDIYEIIKKYSKSPNVRNIYIIGHSQGARIAAALNEKKIKKTAILSVNLYGRFQEEISNLRFNNLLNKQYLKDGDAIYSNYKNLKNAVLIGNDENTLSNISYKSFSFPTTISFLVKKQNPVLIVYGGKDVGVSFSNDLARFEFLNNRKDNIFFKVYNKLNHNFEEENEKEKKFYWQEVFEDVIIWLKQ